jgi:hypothetical protein
MKNLMFCNLFRILIVLSLPIFSLKVGAHINTKINQPKILNVSKSDENSFSNEYLANNLLVKELAVSPHSISLSSEASNSKTFAITSNLLWEISSNQTWLTVDRISGSNNATITIRVSANALTTSRTGAITVSGPGVSDQIVTVTQSASGTDVDIVDDSQIVKVYPNPSKGRVTLSMNNFSGDKISIRVSNLLGIIVNEISLDHLPNSYNHEIDMTNFSNGTYFIIIQTSKVKVVKSIILSKH